MDPGILLHLGFTAAGMLVAWGAGKRAGRSTVSTKAVCPCKHAISFHENLTGSCNAPVFDGVCRCRVYAGPELISSVTMRPIHSIDPPTGSN